MLFFLGSVFIVGILDAADFRRFFFELRHIPVYVLTDSVLNFDNLFIFMFVVALFAEVRVYLLDFFCCFFTANLANLVFEILKDASESVVYLCEMCHEFSE